MQKKFLSALFVAMLVVGCVCRVAMAASPLDFTIVNKSSTPVYGLRIKEHGTEEWSPNILTDILAPDMGAPIEFTDTGSTPVGDILIELDGGNSLTWENYTFGTFTLLVFMDGAQLIPGDINDLIQEVGSK